MLNILTSGLPLSSIDILTEASKEAYGEGSAEIIVLDKDSLRQRVRLSQRNVADVLVILDKVSEDICKDIENGLYSTSKFHSYVDDEDLVNFLNNKLDLHLDITPNPMEVSGTMDSSVNEMIEEYEVKLADKNSLIANLTARVKELTNLVELGGYDEPQVNTTEYNLLEEKYNELKKENLSLHDKLLNSSSSEKENKLTIENLLREKENLESALKFAEESKNSVCSDFKSVNAELTEYKVKYSTQSGLLRTKEEELEKLKSGIGDVGALKENISVLENEKQELKNIINEITLENSKYQVDLSSKDSEIGRLKHQIELGDKSTEQIEVLNAELAKEIEKGNELEKKYSELEISYNTIKQGNEEIYGKYEEEIEKLTSEKESLELRLSTADEDLINLNTERLELLSKITILEKSTDRDSDIESIMSELTELRSKYDNLSRNIFSRISSYALPRSSTTVQLTNKGSHLNNINFVFSGSTESRKGTYKCLLDEVKSLPKSDRVLIVDVVSETSIDYVFEIQKVVTGLDWFRKGGGVQPYLSKTRLGNVQVLSPGLGYLNDTYLLTIDWEQRLSELENSGYRVYICCGDLSNIIGRIMHESFAELGKSRVYIHGNAVGARTIISNLMGISNSNASEICYYDYNKRVEKFYKRVSAVNKCRILGDVNG